jgi:general secretion pathway protein I
MSSRSRPRPHYRARGFTLLEVLIALAIVALSAGALLGSVSSSASNVIYLKERTLAEWVALNRLTEIRMDINMPSVGKRKGNAVMGGSRWEWEEEVSELAYEGMFRIDVRAHDTGEVVDDTKPTEKSKVQNTTQSTASGTSTDKIPWTATVSGVMSSSRAQLRTPVAVQWHVDPSNPGGGPGGPGGPGAQPQPGGEPPPVKPGPSPAN